MLANIRHELRTSLVQTIVRTAFPIIMVWTLPSFQFNCFRPYRVWPYHT